jgi:hypothetical protein
MPGITWNNYREPFLRLIKMGFGEMCESRRLGEISKIRGI